MNVCNGPRPATSLSKTSFTDRGDGVRADNLAHGGVVQAIQMGVCRCLAHQVCIQVQKPAVELHRGRQSDRRAEREERLDHIRRYSTTANQSTAGKRWVCRELIQVATVRYFHIQISIFTFQHIEMAWARHSKQNILSRFKRKSPNRELSPTRFISWQSKAAGNICS